MLMKLIVSFLFLLANLSHGVLADNNSLAIVWEKQNRRKLKGTVGVLMNSKSGLLGLHPEETLCPSECSSEWLGDDWCDWECYHAACAQWDQGDCEGWCAPECPPRFVGDGYCDVDCFRPECNMDADDCIDSETERKKQWVQFPFIPHHEFDYTNCTSCDKELLNNGYCDSECNKLECNLDGRDCAQKCSSECANEWLGDGACDEECNVEECYFDKGDCIPCAPGCSPTFIGNGICDATCYTTECQMDGSDCTDVCAVYEFQYTTIPFVYPHCRLEWRGDGRCDCLCLTEACGFDFDDCAEHDCKEVLKDMKLTWTPTENFKGRF